MTALVVVEAAAILLLGLLVAGLLRSHAEILRQLHQLGAGREDAGPHVASESPVPPPTTAPARRTAHDLAGETPRGDAVAMGVVGAEHDTLLAFLTSGCLTCGGFWEAFADPGHLGLPAGARLVAVTRGPGEESESAILEAAPPGLPVVMSTQAWLDYEVPGSPYFVYVDGARGQVVGEGTGATWEQVAALIGRAGDDRRVARASRRPSDDAAREARVDEELLAAGIHPGHPSLYPADMPEHPDEQ